MTDSVIPVIDIAPFLAGDGADKAAVAAQLEHAFVNSGFAIIAGHGIDEALIDGLYGSAKGFFARPTDEKKGFAPAKRADNIGYLPMGVESVASTLDGKTPPDLCEAFVFRPFHQEELAKGAWRNPRPSEPAEFAALAERYYWEVDRLAADIFRIVALALKLDETYFADKFVEHWNTLRIVNYPDQEIEPAPGQLRYGAHHDYGGLTILRQDSAPGGLQIRDRDGRWHEAPVVPGAFIINIGDLMSRWTNGRWRSTLHRVSNPSRGLTGSTQRLSIVTFVRPDDDVEIVALPGCVDAANPARFPPVKSGEYSRGKIAVSAIDSK